MNIDAFDWLHRTGPNPPDEPVPGDLCASAPASPFLYEGVFAHEYQHLLENYANVDQYTWINEGLADWAAGDLGYFFPAAPITDPKWESGTQCFLGWIGAETTANPNPSTGGAENSLTLWGDQDTDHAGRDPVRLRRCVHVHELPGRPVRHRASSRSSTSAAAGDGLRESRSSSEVRNRASGKGDRARLGCDGGARQLPRRRERRVQRKGSLVSTPRASMRRSTGTPRTPTTLQGHRRTDRTTSGCAGRTGHYLGSRDIGRITFDGAATLPAQPIEWTVDQDPPEQLGRSRALLRLRVELRPRDRPGGRGAGATTRR